MGTPYGAACSPLLTCREPTFMEWELETPPVKGELHVLNLPLWNGNLAQLGNKMLDKPALNLPLWNGN